MEQITTFVLGAISALGIFGLGYGIFTALKINKITKKQQEDIKDLYGAIKELPKIVDEKFKDIDQTHHRRMDDIVRELDRGNEDLHRSLNKRFDETHNRIGELNSYTDSRFDKQADKAGNVISVVSEASLKNSERINKLEELFKIQMDQFAKVTLNHSERLSDLETDKKIQEDRIEQINS
jgi:hypothetical protein